MTDAFPFFNLVDAATAYEKQLLRAREAGDQCAARIINLYSSWRETGDDSFSDLCFAELQHWVRTK